MKDTLGRDNRKLPDQRCANCGKSFRPLRRTSRYCSRPCSWANNGKQSHLQRKPATWWTTDKGYIEGRVWVGDVQIQVKQHRWVMEQALGRPLLLKEHVHHRNGDKADNRLENLELIADGLHSIHHNTTTRIYRRGYKLNLTPEARASRAERMREMRRRK